MTTNRIGLFCIGLVFASFVLVGCGSGSDGGTVDKPLTTNAPPPPARPDKPTISPSGAGGGGGATNSGPAAATGAASP